MIFSRFLPFENMISSFRRYRDLCWFSCSYIKNTLKKKLAFQQSWSQQQASAEKPAEQDIKFTFSARSSPLVKNCSEQAGQENGGEHLSSIDPADLKRKCLESSWNNRGDTVVFNYDSSGTGGRELKCSVFSSRRTRTIIPLDVSSNWYLTAEISRSHFARPLPGDAPRALNETILESFSQTFNCGRDLREAHSRHQPSRNHSRCIHYFNVLTWFSTGLRRTQRRVTAAKPAFENARDAGLPSEFYYVVRQ